MSLKEVRNKLLISHDGVIFQGQNENFKIQGHFSGFKTDLARLMYTVNKPPKYPLLKVAFIVIMHPKYFILSK